MKKILVPVDGSEHALRAIDALIGEMSGGSAPELHLLNVQHSLTGDIGRFLDHQQISGFHREEGLKALEVARQKLDAAGMPYAVHISVGEPAEIIVQYAQEKGCDEIVMGARGHDLIATLLMGSVARAVSDRAGIPVRVVE
jgi:nucleotide-binding universal stress UspA family protein